MDKERSDIENILGTCCICEGTRSVNNVINLNKKAPIPGHGWGCFICNLPLDGAIAVLCDDCMMVFKKGDKQIKFACNGYPRTEGRTKIEMLTGNHEHIDEAHK